MVARDGAAAERGIADRAGCALEAGAVAAASLRRAHRRARAGGFAEQQRGARGRVGLLVVVRLDDLDVPVVGAEQLAARSTRSASTATPSDVLAARSTATASAAARSMRRRGRRARWCRPGSACPPRRRDRGSGRAPRGPRNRPGRRHGRGRSRSRIGRGRLGDGAAHAAVGGEQGEAERLAVGAHERVMAQRSGGAMPSRCWSASAAAGARTLAPLIMKM